MNVAELLANISTYLGHYVDVDGDFVVIQEGGVQHAYLATSHELTDANRQQVRIQHSMSELRKIIQPLPTVQLVYRAVMTNPPYFYRFPVHLSALCDQDAGGAPILRQITTFSAMFPFIGKLPELNIQPDYHYHARLDYEATGEAMIAVERMLIPNTHESMTIDEIEYRYARPLIQQIIMVKGWLLYVPDAEGDHHYIFETYAIRPSLLNWGQREITRIWLKPSPLYKLLRVYHPHDMVRVAVQLTGVIDYVRDETTLPSITPLSALAWVQVHGISLYESHHLF